MSTAAAVAIVVGTAVSIDATRDAAKASKERNKVQTASQKAQDSASLRQQARQERIRRAKILQAGENTGTSGSGREVGSIAALRTQVSANEARVAGQQNTAEGIGELNQDIADSQVQQALGQGIKSIGSSAFSATGGFDNLFKGS